jgi:hypothetical protein
MRYLFPAAPDVTVMFNNWKIELAAEVAFEETVQKMPIYGYRDSAFSKIARGRKIIYGRIVIPLLVPGYLALGAGVPFGNSPDPEDSKEARTIQSVMHGMRTLVGGDERQARIAAIKDLVKNHPEYIDEFREALLGESTQALSNKQGSRSTQRVPGDKKTLHKIDIYYSPVETAIARVSLIGVAFTGMRQIVSQLGGGSSADPIYEEYNFIAKDHLVVMTPKEQESK